MRKVALGYQSLLTLTRSVLRLTWAQIKDAQLLLVASSLAYTTILSIIPVLAVSFAIFQAFGGLDKLYATIEPLILQNLAADASEDAMNAIRGFISNIHAGAIGAGGFIGLILTCMSMLSSAEGAINRVWHAPLNRPIFYRVASYWFFITLGPLALAVVVGFATNAMQSGAALTSYLPSGTGIYLITTLVFFLIYKFVPNRPVHWQPALFSALVTAAVWNLARIGYAIYAKSMVSYGKIYGSLAAIPVLLLWIYIIWVIVLAGAALTAALQKRLEGV